jgi:hypothetical protein
LIWKCLWSEAFWSLLFLISALILIVLYYSIILRNKDLILKRSVQYETINYTLFVH